MIKENKQSPSRRIASNTLMLYVRTFITMIVSLYTSRVILQIIGVDNYGIYNVVGGVLGLFSIISGSLVNSIQRYLTVYLGKGDIEQLRKVFSASIVIQCVISMLLILLAETIGLWFLNYELNIPSDRLVAANFVFQLTIFGTILGLMVVPYNASIISHEKMGVYAYFSIIEVVVKLALIYTLWIIPGDKLILYAVIMLILPLSMQFLNVVYCKRHFVECKFDCKFDRAILYDMGKFASWNFIGNASGVFCSQGINILLNLFFGISVNAARGVVSQVESAIRRFTDNFMTAVNPQITKSYTCGDIDYVKYLMDMSSRLSFFLFLLISLPIYIEATELLNLWLVDVPEQTVIFLRFTIFLIAILIIANSSYTVMMATGRIKKYQLYASISGLLVLPISWLMYKFNAPAYFCYICLMLHYLYVGYIRLYILQKQLDEDLMSWFFSTTLIPIIRVSVISIIIPVTIDYFLTPSLKHVIVVLVASVVSSLASIYWGGLKSSERKYIKILYNDKIRPIFSIK